MAKKVIHGVRSGGDWIDDKLNQLSSIPYLGSSTQEAVENAMAQPYARGSGIAAGW